MDRQEIIEKINNIADKYRFRNNYEIEMCEIMDFCRAILQSTHLGLNLDEKDLSFIQTVLYGN